MPPTWGSCCSGCGTIRSARVSWRVSGSRPGPHRVPHPRCCHPRDGEWGPPLHRNYSHRRASRRDHHDSPRRRYRFHPDPPSCRLFSRSSQANTYRTLHPERDWPCRPPQWPRPRPVAVGIPNRLCHPHTIRHPTYQVRSIVKAATPPTGTRPVGPISLWTNPLTPRSLSWTLCRR